jgi:hypothetical protein
MSIAGALFLVGIEIAIVLFSAKLDGPTVYCAFMFKRSL